MISIVCFSGEEIVVLGIQLGFRLWLSELRIRGEVLVAGLFLNSLYTYICIFIFLFFERYLIRCSNCFLFAYKSMYMLQTLVQASDERSIIWPGSVQGMPGNAAVL